MPEPVCVRVKAYSSAIRLKAMNQRMVRADEERADIGGTNVAVSMLANNCRVEVYVPCDVRRTCIYIFLHAQFACICLKEAITRFSQAAHYTIKEMYDDWSSLPPIFGIINLNHSTVNNRSTIRCSILLMYRKMLSIFLESSSNGKSVFLIKPNYQSIYHGTSISIMHYSRFPSTWNGTIVIIVVWRETTKNKINSIRI